LLVVHGEQVLAARAIERFVGDLPQHRVPRLQHALVARELLPGPVPSGTRTLTLTTMRTRNCSGSTVNVFTMSSWSDA
jgi:hypothetical protein